jgi:hypothetical protein
VVAAGAIFREPIVSEIDDGKFIIYFHRVGFHDLIGLHRRGLVHVDCQQRTFGRAEMKGLMNSSAIKPAPICALVNDMQDI